MDLQLVTAQNMDTRYHASESGREYHQEGGNKITKLLLLQQGLFLQSFLPLEVQKGSFRKHGLR